MPQDWRYITHKQRVDALYEYTRDIVKARSDANVLVDMVQIGIMR